MLSQHSASRFGRPPSTPLHPRDCTPTALRATITKLWRRIRRRPDRATEMAACGHVSDREAATLSEASFSSEDAFRDTPDNLDRERTYHYHALGSPGEP